MINKLFYTYSLKEVAKNTLMSNPVENWKVPLPSWSEIKIKLQFSSKNVFFHPRGQGRVREGVWGVRMEETWILSSLVWYWLLNIPAGLDIGYFNYIFIPVGSWFWVLIKNFSHRSGPGIGFKIVIWLVWYGYIYISLVLRLVHDGYYLKFLVVTRFGNKVGIVIKLYCLRSY
jgi:hypothetical protein